MAKKFAERTVSPRGSPIRQPTDHGSQFSKNRTRWFSFLIWENASLDGMVRSGSIEHLSMHGSLNPQRDLRSLIGKEAVRLVLEKRNEKRREERD